MSDDENGPATNAQAIIDVTKEAAASVEDMEIGDVTIPVLVTHDSANVLTDVLKHADERADKPRRRKGTANMQAIDSLCAHVNRFKSVASTIFANAAKREIVAVLNYHPAGPTSDPAWGDHRAVYPCPLSPEWQAWGGGGEKAMSQDAFAQFLDEHDADMACGAADSKGRPYPSPADLMTLALSLETYSGSKCKRTRDPVRGSVSVEYQEESGVKGVQIPPAFAIKIPVFVDSAPSVLEVRLRVEVADGKPTFRYGIHDGVKVLRAAFDALCDHVEAETELLVLVGTPEQ